MENTGTETVDNPVLGYYINGNFVFEETITASIAPGESYAHSFSQVSGFTPGTLNTVVAVLTAEGDENLSDDAIRTAIDPDLVIGTQEWQAEPGLKVFPNPTDGVFGYEVDDLFLGGRIQVWDSQGRLIETVAVQANKAQVSCLLRQTGVFYLIAQAIDGTRVVIRVVVL